MIEVTIERLGHLGDGLAGGLRVPFTLPGERVRGPVDGNRLAPAEILDPSPDRIDPPCPLFGACGGCALQHASPAFLAGWKRDLVTRALAAQGLTAPFAPSVTVPPRSRLRATLTGARHGASIALGFLERASDRLTDIPDCHILHPDIIAARSTLVALTRLAATRNRPVRLHVTRSDAGLDIDVTASRPLDRDLRAALAALAGDHDLARLSWSGETLALARPPVHRFGRAFVTPPPGAFLQATAEGAAALVAAVRTALGAARPIADLFAGCGTFALPLAESADVHAVEGEAAMLAALAAAARATPGLRRVTTETRDLFRRPLLPADLARYDAVVLDPPRAGAEAQSAALAASRVPVVAAVSCNPVTFARDAKILVAGGYRLDWVQVIDQFLWSGHVELAARFSRQAATP